MNKQEKFKQASEREREYFIQFNEKQNDFTISHFSPSDAFSSWDVIYLSAGTEIVAEIKVRDNFMNDYRNGWILEKQKYDNLMEIYKTRKRDFSVYYVNFFKDGVVMWDLRKEIPNFFLKNCNKQTVISNEEKKEKLIALLKIEDGVIYKYKK